MDCEGPGDDDGFFPVCVRVMHVFAASEWVPASESVCGVWEERGRGGGKLDGVVLVVMFQGLISKSRTLHDGLRPYSLNPTSHPISLLDDIS